MQGLALLILLLLLFVVLGLRVKEVSGPVRLVVAMMAVAITGWYLLF
ncbi:MAG: hypothetical protein ABSC13_01910 [Dehalococcoidia bacterium]|jgi:hypothetical protein